MQRRGLLKRVGAAAAMLLAGGMPYGLMAPVAWTGPRRHLPLPGALANQDAFTAACIGCDMCGEVCPTRCIQLRRRDGARTINMPFINPEEKARTLYGKYMAICPTDALVVQVTRLIIVMAMLGWCAPAQAHHILGRPAYSLNEDSNTPPSMQVEAQIGEYLVSYMVFPAFPRPNVPGRINLYASHLDTGEPLTGKVTFKVREDGWFADSEEEVIGTQLPDDNVYRQGFVFKEGGDYIITAAFEAGNAPYLVDFPLPVGNTAPMGLLGVVIAILGAVLLGVSIAQRKRLTRAKVRKARQEGTLDARPTNDMEEL